MTEPITPPITPPLSRRDFLKLSRLFGGVVGMNLYPPAQSLLHALESAKFPPDLDFSAYPQYKFDLDTQRVITQVETEKNIRIISPKFWFEPKPSSVNLPWLPLENFQTLAATIESLPSEYFQNTRSPKQYVLLREPDSSSEGAGGGYTSRCIMLNIASDYNGQRQMSGYANSIYGTEKNHLRYRIAHETTHSYVEAYPDLLEDWIKTVGWKKVDGVWINSDSNNLASEDNAAHDPNEDLALSFGRLFVNPGSISQARKDFFLSNPHYSSWTRKYLSRWS